MIEKILYNNDDLLAIIIRSDFSSEGIVFFTPDNFSQQLGYMNRPAGFKIEPHFHNKVRREVLYTQEVLLIKKGKVRINFFSQSLHLCDSKILYTGDVILLASGGHSLEMLDNSEIIEIKQGPYSGDSDKTRFDGESSYHMPVGRDI